MHFIRIRKGTVWSTYRQSEKNNNVKLYNFYFKLYVQRVCFALTKRKHSSFVDDQAVLGEDTKLH